MCFHAAKRAISLCMLKAINNSSAVNKTASRPGMTRCLVKSLSAFCERPGIKSIMVRLTKKKVSITEMPVK